MSIIPNYVPSQFKTVNVFLPVKNAAKAIEFYNRAFGAEEVMRLTDPEGKIIHAEIRFADTLIMLFEEDPRFGLSPATLGGTSAVIQIYTPDVETFVEEAVMAGAEVMIPIEEQFYGDRSGRIRDPFGHQWIVATHVESITTSELQKRFHEMYS
jgi:PhnB protein